MQCTREHFGDPLFMSYYSVGEGGATHIEETGSLSGYDGPLYLDEVVVDIDATDLEDARALMLDAVRLLKSRDVPDAALRVWFSGGKGYHLHLPRALLGIEGSVDSNGAKGRLSRLFGEMAAPKGEAEPHIDLSLTANATKLIRAPWSRHEDTARYKVPIRADERSARAEMHAHWASDPRTHREGVTHAPCEAEIPVLSGLRDKPGDRPPSGSGVSNARSESVTGSDNSDDNESDVPTPHYVTCMWHLARRGPVDGRRHDDMLRLAAAHAYRGASAGEIEAMLTSWLDAPEKGLPMDDEGKQDAKDMALRATGQHPNGDGSRWDRFRCDDEIMSEYCDPQCVFYKYREEEEPIATDEQLNQSLIDYLDYDPSDALDIGYAVGSSQSLPVLPSEICTLYGNTGLGKTSLLQAVSLAHDHLTVLDVTTEMSSGLQSRRYLQIKEGLRVEGGDLQGGVDEVRALADEKGPEHVMALREEVCSHIDIMTVRPYLSDLERHVRENQADVLVLDPVGKVRVENGGEAPTPEVYKELKDIVRRLDIIVLAVRHIRKSGMGERLPSMSHVKGHKVITEESDHVVAFGGERDGRMRQLKRVKGTRDIDFDVTLKGDPETLRFRAVQPAAGGPTEGGDTAPSHDGSHGPDKIDLDGISNRQNLPS
jgi:hypothetical protein